MKVGLRFNLFNFETKFNVSFVKKKVGFVIGSYSLCHDGKHVVYLDYDRFRREWMEQELTYLIEKYKLSDFYILSSSSEGVNEKFHAVCFDKTSPKEYQIIAHDSNCDTSFKNINNFDYHNARVLRFSGKSNSKINHPVLISIIKSLYNLRHKSKMHLDMYSKLGFIPEHKMNRINQDNSDNVKVVCYTTRNI